MKKHILTLFLIITTLSAFAHGSDVSSMVLVEKEDDTWTLQVRSSLNAFRKEVRLHFYDCAYQSKEEFNEQLLEHFDNTLSLTVNNQNIDLGKGAVKLGHETTVFYKNIKIPQNINSLQINGSMFKEIYNSKVRVYVLRKEQNKTNNKETTPKKPFTLSKKNNFKVNLTLKENDFVLNEAKNTVHLFFPIIILGMGLLNKKATV